MLNHKFDSQKNEALNKAFTKVAPKNMVFSKTHSLFDQLALVMIYNSIGYAGCLTAILGALLGTINMKLNPVEASWATQLDKQYQKKVREKTRKLIGQRSAGKCKRLYSDQTQDARAKQQGDIYKSGSAFMAKVSVEVAPVILETQNADIAILQPIGVPMLPPGIEPGTPSATGMIPGDMNAVHVVHVARIQKHLP